MFIRESVTKYLPLFFAVLAPVIPALMLLDAFRFRARVSDYPEYYTAACMLVNGEGSNIYDLAAFGARQSELFPDMTERVVGFYLVPQAVPMILPFSALPAQQGFLFWFAFSLAAFVAACLVISKLLSLEQRRREVAIHRVIGGTSQRLQRMVLAEILFMAIARLV